MIRTESPGKAKWCVGNREITNFFWGLLIVLEEVMEHFLNFLSSRKKKVPLSKVPHHRTPLMERSWGSQGLLFYRPLHFEVYTGSTRERENAGRWTVTVIRLAAVQEVKILHKSRCFNDYGSSTTKWLHNLRVTHTVWPGATWSLKKQSGIRMMRQMCLNSLLKSVLHINNVTLGSG